MKNRKKKHVLVTGGAGYIGSILVPLLLKKGYAVTIFDAFFFGKKSIKHFSKNIHIIQGDVRNPPNDLFDTVDVVIHLAALSNDPTAEFNPIANKEINTEGTKVIGYMAKKAGVKRFIFASSCSIYDCGLHKATKIKTELARVNPKNPYSQSKFFAEKALLRLSDATFTPVVLRKGTVYGWSPRMRYDLIINTMVRDALRYKKLHIFCKGMQWRPLISIHDVAEAYVLAIQAPERLVKGKIINISAGNYQVDFIAKEVQRVFKKAFHTEISLIYENDNKIDRSYKVSTKRAERILGFMPKDSIEKSIRSLVQYILKHKTFQQFSNPLFYNMEHMKPILQQMAHLPTRK